MYCCSPFVLTSGGIPKLRVVKSKNLPASTAGDVSMRSEQETKTVSVVVPNVGVATAAVVEAAAVIVAAVVWVRMLSTGTAGACMGTTGCATSGWCSLTCFRRLNRVEYSNLRAQNPQTWKSDGPYGSSITRLAAAKIWKG